MATVNSGVSSVSLLASNSERKGATSATPTRTRFTFARVGDRERDKPPLLR
jgi:hypothetical protein